MLRRVVVLGGVGLAVFAVLFASSPTAKGYTITATTTDYATTTGGGGFVGPASCATGSVIYEVGASGNAGITSLTRPVANCVDLNTSATTHNSVTGSLATSNWGGAGDRSFTATRCTTSQVVVGMVVHKQASGYVSGWNLICGTLPAGGSRTTDSVTFGWPNAGTASPSQRETIQCPTGMVAVGLVAWVGTIMDRIGFRCGTITGANQADVTITSASNITFGSTLALSAAGGTTGGTLSFATTGACSVSGTTLTATGNAGATCSVTATRAGDENYAAKASATQTVTIQRAANTISFTNPGVRTWSATPFNVTVSATSGITPSVTSTTTSVCSVSGIAVTMLSSGTCSLTATQGETTNHAAAVAVSHNFTINPTGRSAFTGNSATISGTTTGSKYVVERFTTTGASTWTVPQGVTSIDYLVVGGGGGGGGHVGGGGGAGGVRTGSLAVTPGSSVSLTIGAGGAGSIGGTFGDCSATNRSKSGSNSILSTITAAGGGGGGNWDYCAALNGGSGGGGGTTNNAGAGNTPLTSPSQGNNGGGGSGWTGGNYTGGGGGGAGSVGTAGQANVGGNGGTGVQSGITGVMSYYGGGGGGGVHSSTGNGGVTGVAGTGGLGGGGNGNVAVLNGTAGAGQANTGGGGGGAGYQSGTLGSSNGGAGGSGIVVVRYELPTVTTPNLLGADDTGITTDDITSTRTLRFWGNAPLTSSIQLSVAPATSVTDTDSSTGTWTTTGSGCTANSTGGEWECTTAQLAPGLYKVRSIATTNMDGLTDTQTSSTALVVNVDTTAPTIAVTRSGAGTLLVGQTETITFTLSEASSTFAADDITLSGGTISTLSTTSSTVYSVVFTPTSNTDAGTGSISVALSRFTDTAGNNNTASNALSIPYDTTRPSVTMTANPASVTSGSATTVTFTVSESVTTFTSTDVSVLLGTLTSFSGSGRTYTATFTASPSSGGTAVITVASGSITDSNTNANTSAFTLNITVTNAASSSGGRTSYLSDGTNGTNGVRYFVERFTTTGSSTWTVPQGVTTVDVLAIGGGGGAGDNSGGGGSGGGVAFQSNVAVSGTVNISVGTGGAAGTSATDHGKNGLATSFGSVSAGGGNGGRSNSGTGGASVTGSGAGGNGSTSITVLGLPGGDGPSYSITGTPTNYAGGGGGGGWISNTSGGAGGAGGGGAGGGLNGPSGLNGVAGTNGLGGGGGSGSNQASTAGAGGSGIIVLRYSVPAASTPDLDAADDTGTNTDNITSSTTLTFTGSAPVGSTVQLFVDGVSSGNTCTANSTTGAWTCDTAVLTAGDKVITAQSTTILSDSTVTSTSSSLTVTIDTTAPTVSSVSFSSNSGSDDTYKTGDVVSVTVAFSENVNVTNSPRIELAGLTSRSATYASGSGTSSLVFTYTVLSGDNDADGLAIAANTLLLNSGTIRDTAANNATLTHSAVTAQSTHKVEAVAPTVDISRAGTGTLKSGQTETITFTLSEASSDFAADDISVVGGSIGTLTTSSSTVYSAVFTPTTNTQSGSGSISVTAAKFTDAPGNENTASTTLPIPYDTAAPTVLLARSGSGSLRSGQTSTITFTLSEASSTFTVGDITVSGGSIGALTTTSSTVYSVVFTPTSNTDSGAGSISVDGAAFTDTVGNVNTASTALTISYDTSSPTIDITRSGTGMLLVGQTETITFTLSEASSTFAADDITFSGGTISALTTTSSTVYSAVFTPTINTNSGIGSISVALSRFTDTAGNNNTASNALSISYDTSPPSVTMTANPASVTSGSNTAVTFTVSESVTTFTSADVSTRLGTLTNFSGSGTSYTATFTASPTTGGTAVITVASGSITDSNTNANTSAFAFEITVTNTATSSGGRTSYVGNGSNGTNGVRYIVERFITAGTTAWTVPRGISSIDYLVVGGGAGGGSRHAGGGGAGGLRSSVTSTGGGASPESAMTVTPGGSLTVTVGAGGASWTNGSDSVLGNVTSIGGGTQSTAGGSGGGTNCCDAAGGSGTANQGFNGGRGTGSGTASNWLWAGGGGGGAGAAGSNAGSSGGNAFGGAGGAGVTNSITGAAVCYAGGGGGGYSNQATNAGTIEGGKCGSTMVGGTSPRGANATAGATNTGSGGGGGGFDGGSGNYAGGGGGSGIVVVRYAVPDVTTPDLDASDDTGTNTDNITSATTLTFTGSAPVGSTVQLFVDGVSSGNTCATNSTTGAWTCDTATLTAGNKVITAQSTTLLPDSTVTSTSSGLTVTIDTTAPTIQVTRSGSGALTVGQTEIITFTLSEASSTFAADDITFSGGTISALTTTSSTVYSVVFTPTSNTNSGTGSISVALSRFSDMAGNNNTVSNTVSFTYDTARPTVSLSGCASSYAAGSTCSITITLSDAVTDLLLADFNVTRGSLSGLTASGTTRTVTYTASGPTGGTASVSLAAGAFTDANGNTSTASNTLNVDIAASNTRQMMTSLSASGVSVADNTNGASRYIVQTFAATGSTTWTPPQGVTRVDLLVVGGGGGGGSRGAGAGGAGGYIEASNFAVTPGSSYTVVTGAGGAGGVVANNDSGAAGSASSFTLSSVGLTANGGGAGLSHSFNGNGGASGTGSGAGGTAFNNAGGNGAASGTCGSTSDWCGGGGGGAGSAGVNAVTTGGNGGNGRASSISGISTTYAGGGGGGGGDSSQPSNSPSPGGNGGTGGGGNGGSPTWDGTNCRAGAGINGTTNTGGGGGGGSYCSGTQISGTANGGGGSGGSGIVIVRYVLPSVATPDLAVASDNGTSTTDNLTSNRTLTFDGSAPVTASVQLSVATATSATDTDVSAGTWTDSGATCTANTTSGAWSCTTAELAPGLYKVRSKATTTMDGITDTQISSTALVVEIDTTAPTVSSVSFTSSSGSDGTYKSGDVISVTVAFSENVAVTNSPRIALAGLSSKFAIYASGSGTTSLVFTYTVAAGDTDTDGLAIQADSLALNSGTIRDAVSNDATLTHSAVSTDSTQKVDTTAPTVTITRAGSGSLKSGQTETVTFTLSEASSDFTIGDITFSGGTIGTLTTTSSTVYTVVFTPTTNTQSGTGSISVAGAQFTDAAGNNNTASSTLSISYDTAAPTVTVTRAGSTTLRSSQTETVTFTLSEASSTFAADDITFSGGTIGTLSTTSSTVYSVVFTPTTNTQSGTGSISVAGATFTDTLGNDNNASSTLSITYDTAAPTVTITRAGSGSLKSGQTETVTFTLSETSSNFISSDVTVTGGAIGSFAGSGISYTATFTPTSNTQSGTGSISVAGATFTDTLGNDNTASTSLSITYDTAAPTVTITRAGSGSLKSGQTETITVTLSEASSDFVVGDITVAGGTIGTLTTTSSTVYSVVFTPTTNTQSGTGSISVAGATFTDTLGNDNTASSTLSITYDTLAPTATVSRSYSGSIGVRANQTITFTLSEASSTFTAADIAVTGGSIGSLTTVSSTVYRVLFTPTADTESGTATLSIDGAKFTDSAGNDNTASNILSVPFDTREPTVAITRAGSTTLRSGQTDIITFTLSEASSTFTAADITVSGGSIGALTTTSSTVYSVVFTPTTNTQSGTGSISVAATRFTDATGNGNIASSTRSVPYDTLAASVSNVTSSTANGTIGIGSPVSIQIVFSEAVTVSGTPQLTLETGATDRVASYASGSGTDTLTFTYTVQSGDTSSDLEYTSTSALALNGGTIVDSVGNAATLTLPAPGATGSLAINTAIVVASAPTQVVSVRTPLGPASGAAFSQQPRVSLQDTGGSVVTSDSSTVVTATVSNGASLVGTVTATAVNGVVTFNDLGISGTAGTAYTITYSATVSGNALTAATQSVTPTVGAATQISVSTQPVGDTAGALLATAPVVSVLDSGNNVVTSASTSITVSSSGGTLNGTKTVSTTNGLATFGDLTFAGTAGTNYTLTFTTASLGSATSNNFSVGVGAATKLAITTQASGAAYNEAFTTQPVIEIRDAGNNKVPSAANVVTATLSNGTVLGSNNTSLNATSSSGVATFSGLGITGLPGSYTITYSSGALVDTSHSISLVKANQTITFTDPTDRPWSATSFALTPTASSGLSVSLTSTTTSICTVSGLDITMVTVGTCSLTATQSGNDYFNAASTASQSFDIAQASQTVSFSDPADRPWSATTFDVAPTATSGLTTTVASTTSAVCTVSGTTITMVKAGTCTLTASQAGNTVYSAATTVTQSFVIELATQSAFSLTSTTATFGANLTLTTTGGSGSGSVTFTKVSGDCSISNTTLTPTSASTCVVTATKAADSQYDSTSDTQTITINRAAQSTPLTLAATTVVYGQTLTLSGSGGEGTGTISYAVSSGTCTLNGAVLTPGNAGSLCEVEVTRALSTNYNSSTSAPISITIQQATPTVGTLVLATKTYGDAPFAFSAPSATYNSASVAGSWSYASAQTSVATINGDTATITGGGTSAITATFTPTDSTNYTTAATTSTLTVDKAVPTFSWSNVDATYNDADITIVSPAVATTAATGTWTYSSADTSVVTVSGTKFDVGNAGSAVITATFTPSNTTNYVSSETTTMTFTVGRANQASLGISSVTGTYGTALTLATSGGTTNGSVTWGVSNGSASDCSVTGGQLTTTSIGTCTVTAVMAGSSNYFSVSNVGTTVTINAKPIIVTATAKFKTYGDNDPALTFTTAAGALVGNDTLTGALNRVAGDTVGEYTINQGTVDNTNYDISYTTAKLTINAKPITVTATAKFKTYGDNDPALTYTTPVGALVGNDTLTGALTRVAGDTVGEYTITRGSVANSNYDITYTSAKLTINAKPITVTATAKFKTYGDNDPALTFTTAAGALVGNDTLAGSLTRVAGVDVGDYTINQGTVTNTNNTNYDISFTSAKLTINAKPITVTAEPKTKIYNTNDPALTYTTPVGALVGNDTLAGALARVSGEQVASYPIRIGTLNNSNYLITFVDSALSITPAQQSQLTVTTATITYQTPVALQATGGTEGDLGFSVVSSGSAGCSILNGTLSASGNAGSTCTVKATRAATTNFSQIDSSTATITVTRRAITVTGTAEEKTYGDADPGFRFTVSAGSLHGSDSLTGSLARAAGLNVGTYTINQGTLDNPNYTITYVPSQLTVIPRPITVTATNKTKIFGQPDPVLEYTVTTGNIVPSDVIPGEITRAVGETLGNYNITRGTLGDNYPNYNITFVSGIFQITGAPQAGFTLTASSYSVVYQQTIAVQTSGGNGQGTVSYSAQNGTGSCSIAGTTVTGTTAGTCTVTATKAAEGGYLEAISNPITVTVEKADQTITFAQIIDHNYSPTPMAITPTASSGAAVSIGTRTPNVCSTDDLEVQMLDSGMCTIAAEVASSRNYNAAPTVTRSFEIRAVVPFAPTITAVEPGDTTVSVVFTPGLSGGAAITTYRYSVDDGGRWTDLPSGTTSSPIILGNLPNTVEAKVRIMAVNRVGNGARSNMRAATPVAKRSLEWEVQRNTVSGTQSPNSAATALQASQLPPAPARVTVQSVSGGRRTQVTAVRAAKDANIPVTYALISVRTRTNKLLARIKVLVDPTNPTTSVSVPYASSRVRVSVQFANDMGISSGGPAGINIAEGNTLEWTTVSNEARIKGTEVKGDLVFARGKSTLTYAMQQNLKKMAATVNARGGLIYVSGFAQKGELKSAWMLEPLARARAEAVAKYLAKIGVRQWITFHGSTSAAMKGWQPVTGRQVVITTVMPNEI